MEAPDADLHARLDRIEAQLQRIQDRVESPPKAEGGIGCLGIILFLILFMQIGDLADLVRTLAN